MTSLSGLYGGTAGWAAARCDSVRRILAIVERELRRFRRRMTVMIMALVLPLVQLVVLGYAFGGHVKHVRRGSRSRCRGQRPAHARQ